MGTIDTWAEASLADRERSEIKMRAGRPVCSMCGEPITGCDAYRNGPDWFDEDCWRDYVRDEFYVDLDLYLGDE